MIRLCSIPFGIAALLVLAGCAHTGPRFERAASMDAAALDPWEKPNRKIYAINKAVDGAVMKPVVSVYRAVLPEAGRRGIRNMYDNFGEPLNFANAVLQGKFGSAFRALDRALVNTLLGVGGVADHATGMGLPEQPHDFGQTLTVYGVHSGPYFMLPFFGPSTLRDGVGFGVDFVADPLDFAGRKILTTAERFAKIGFRVVDARAKLADTGEQLLTGSADEYATVRSAWLQIRRVELFDGAPPADPVDDEEILPYDAPASGAASAPALSPSPAPAPDSGTVHATPATPDPAALPPQF